MTDLLAAYRHTTDNRVEIEASALCGCCNCLQTFPPSEIVAWAGLDISSFDDPASSANAGTALCPHCGSEAVLADSPDCPVDAALLGQMNEAWFQKTIIRRPNPKR